MDCVKGVLRFVLFSCLYKIRDFRISLRILSENAYSPEIYTSNTSRKILNIAIADLSGTIVLKTRHSKLETIASECESCKVRDLSRPGFGEPRRRSGFKTMNMLVASIGYAEHYDVYLCIGRCEKCIQSKCHTKLSMRGCLHKSTREAFSLQWLPSAVVAFHLEQFPAAFWTDLGSLILQGSARNCYSLALVSRRRIYHHRGVTHWRYWPA